MLLRILLSTLILCFGLSGYPQNVQQKYLDGKEFYRTGKHRLAMETFRSIANPNEKHSLTEYASFYFALAAYQDGQVLVALETEDCNGDGPSMVPFTLTQTPSMSGARLRLNHNPSGGYNMPGGFNNAVEEGCAVIGAFHVVQYRINPLPPADNPSLQRRNIGLGEDWNAVSANIENLQFQYSQGTAQLFEDVPSLVLDADNPDTWITGVRLTVGGRSQSTTLQGGSAGVFAAGDTHLRKSFSTSIILRNQLGKAAVWAEENSVAGWN